MTLDRRWRPLAGLAIVAALMALALALDRGASEEARRAAQSLVPGLRAPSVTRFRLTREGRTLAFEKRAGPAASVDEAGWWIEGLGRADDRAVDELLDALEWAHVERRPPLDLTAAGLKPERLAIAVEGVRVVIGALDGTGDGAYALRDGAVVVTDARIRALCDVDEARLRDRSPTAVPVESATSLSLVTPATKARLVRRDGSWRLAEPWAAWLDGARVAELVAALGDAEALRFATADEVRADEAASITVLVDGRERARVAGRCAGGWWRLARWDGAVTCFDGGALAPLARPVGELRSRVALPLDPASLRSVALGAGALTLERGPDGWTLRSAAAPTKAPADEEVVRALLDALTTTEGRLVDGAVTSEAALRAVFGDDAGARVTLTPGHLGGTPVVTRDDEPGGIAVPPSWSALLKPDPLAFRARRVLSLRESDVTRVILDGALAIARDGAGWRLDATTPHAPSVDGEAIDRLVAAVTSLRADRFATPAASDGTEHPTRRLRVELAGGVSPVELAIGRRDAAGCSARLVGDAATMRLAPSTCDALLAPLAR